MNWKLLFGYAIWWMIWAVYQIVFGHLWWALVMDICLMMFCLWLAYNRKKKEVVK